MAKASTRSAGDNYKWSCMTPDCGTTQDGFTDLDAAAASASEHQVEAHPEVTVTPSFSYENLNPPSDPPPPPDLQALWDAVPTGNLTKSNLAPFMKAAFGLK